MSDLTINSTIGLNSGWRIPRLGFGLTHGAPYRPVQQLVEWAVDYGYRLFDSAKMLDNETAAGNIFGKLWSMREKTFIVAKLSNVDHGYIPAMYAFHRSMNELQLDYVDLYLIHTPVPGKELRLESWRGIEKVVFDKKCRSIGVSNYGIHHLEELFENCRIKPAVNQLEVHPWLRRHELIDFCRENDVVVEAYSPLTKGRKLKDPKLNELAKKYGKTSAQILIRWCLQNDFPCIPRSTREERIISNTQVFDFNIDMLDMEYLDSLDCNYKTGWDPTTAP